MSFSRSSRSLRTAMTAMTQLLSISLGGRARQARQHDPPGLQPTYPIKVGPDSRHSAMSSSPARKVHMCARVR